MGSPCCLRCGQGIDNGKDLHDTPQECINVLAERVAFLSARLEEVMAGVARVQDERDSLLPTIVLTEDLSSFLSTAFFVTAKDTDLDSLAEIFDDEKGVVISRLPNEKNEDFRARIRATVAKKFGCSERKGGREDAKK